MVTIDSRTVKGWHGSDPPDHVMNMLWLQLRLTLLGRGDFDLVCYEEKSAPVVAEAVIIHHHTALGPLLPGILVEYWFENTMVMGYVNGITLCRFAQRLDALHAGRMSLVKFILAQSSWNYVPIPWTTMGFVLGSCTKADAITYARLWLRDIISFDDFNDNGMIFQKEVAREQLGIVHAAPKPLTMSMEEGQVIANMSYQDVWLEIQALYQGDEAPLFGYFASKQKRVARLQYLLRALHARPFHEIDYPLVEGDLYLQWNKEKLKKTMSAMLSEMDRIARLIELETRRDTRVVLQQDLLSAKRKIDIYYERFDQLANNRDAIILGKIVSQ